MPTANKPPISLETPILVSCDATWILKTVPAAIPVINTINKLPGPDSIS